MPRERVQGRDVRRGQREVEHRRVLDLGEGKGNAEGEDGASDDDGGPPEGPGEDADDNGKMKGKGADVGSGKGKGKMGKGFGGPPVSAAPSSPLGNTALCKDKSPARDHARLLLRLGDVDQTLLHAPPPEDLRGALA